MYRHTVHALTAALALFLFPAHGAAADELLIERIHRPPPGVESVQRPARGMRMQAVRAAYGQPERTLGPVGDPPITQWVYPAFVVYFDGEHVIHSVWRRE